MAPSNRSSRVRGHDLIWQDGRWHVYAPDGTLRDTFTDKADATLFVMRQSSQDRMASHQERIKQAERESRTDGRIPSDYGTLMLTGMPFLWHFVMIILVIIFSIGVGIPILSNLFNSLFGTGEARTPIQVANIFSSISLLYLSILAIGAAILAVISRTGGQGGGVHKFLAGMLFNAALFGILLVGVMSFIAIGLSIFGMLGFTFARTVGYAAGLIFGIYALNNYFYREMLS